MSSQRLPFLQVLVLTAIMCPIGVNSFSVHKSLLMTVKRAVKMHTSKWQKNFEEEVARRALKANEKSIQKAKAKSRYVPPEQWNHTLDMTFDKRVMFEAQRDGNRWKQNGILNKNLGAQ